MLSGCSYQFYLFVTFFFFFLHSFTSFTLRHLSYSSHIFKKGTLEIHSSFTILTVLHDSIIQCALVLAHSQSWARTSTDLIGMSSYDHDWLGLTFSAHVSHFTSIFMSSIVKSVSANHRPSGCVAAVTILFYLKCLFIAVLLILWPGFWDLVSFSFTDPFSPYCYYRISPSLFLCNTLWCLSLSFSVTLIIMSLPLLLCNIYYDVSFSFSLILITISLSLSLSFSPSL